MKMLLIGVVIIVATVLTGYDGGEAKCGSLADPYSLKTVPTAYSKDAPNGLGGFVHFEWETICVEPGDILTVKAEFIPDLKVVIKNHGRHELQGLPGTWPNIDVDFVGSSPVPDYNKRSSVLGIRWNNYNNGSILVRYGILQEGSTSRDYKFASLRKE